MDCPLVEQDGRWVCPDCGFSYHKPVRKMCGSPIEPTCPCGTKLKKKQVEGLWHLWCVVCRKSAGLCTTCNRKQNKPDAQVP